MINTNKKHVTLFNLSIARVPVLESPYSGSIMCCLMVWSVQLCHRSCFKGALRPRDESRLFLHCHTVWTAIKNHFRLGPNMTFKVAAIYKRVLSQQHNRECGFGFTTQLTAISKVTHYLYEFEFLNRSKLNMCFVSNRRVAVNTYFLLSAYVWNLFIHFGLVCSVCFFTLPTAKIVSLPLNSFLTDKTIPTVVMPVASFTRSGEYVWHYVY